jgi:hypothetical protein
MNFPFFLLINQRQRQVTSPGKSVSLTNGLTANEMRGRGNQNFNQEEPQSERETMGVFFEEVVVLRFHPLLF